MIIQLPKRLAGALALASALLALSPLADAQEAQEEPADPRLAPMSVHYARLSQAYAERDAGMVVAYRTPDFYVELPNGTRIDRDTATAALVDFFQQSTPPIEVRADVQCAQMRGETEAEFIVIQNIGRTMPFDGEPKRVISAITQTETWRLLPEGWRLASVSGMHDTRRWVDGVEIDPSQPYDPAAAPFTPPPRTPLVCEPPAPPEIPLQ